MHKKIGQAEESIRTHPPRIASDDSPAFKIGTDESQSRKWDDREVTEIVSSPECVCVCA